MSQFQILERRPFPFKAIPIRFAYTNFPDTILIDYEFCTGCQSCEIACKQEHGFGIGKWGIRVLDEGPWEIDEKTVNWNKIPTPTSLCDLCAERTAGGKLPTCVHHCLAGVMKFGPIDQLVEELDKKPNQVLFVPGPYTCKA